MMRMHVPDMWANRGRYRTRPDGSLFPKEQRRLREMMARQHRGQVVGEDAQSEKAESLVSAETGTDGSGAEEGGE